MAATAAMKSGRAATPYAWPRRASCRGRAGRSAAMSTSSITAAITTAASVASGSCSNRPVRTSSVTIVSAATTSPESWRLRARARR